MEFTRCIQKGPIKFYSTAQPTNIRADSCKILWKPSVYGGDGTELNCNICMSNLDDDVKNDILDLERRCLNENFISCVKNDYVKCKIKLDKVELYDIDNKRIQKIDDWENLLVNVMLKISGKWESKTQSGLCINVVAMQIVGKQQYPESVMK